MATIPRYQELGVQYADLPRVSTALQQARATGFDQLSRSLDRMTAYLQGERETQVKKEAIKYAVDNPITSEQLEAALKDPKALQIQGAGQVFQETYQAYAAAQLSSELQLQASSELKRIELDVENNKIDAMSATVKMQDLLDGQSALMTAVSPEYSVKHRAALASLAATSRNKIYDTQQKAYIAVEGAKLDLALQGLPQALEDVIKYNANSIDPQTGKPVDVQKLMAIQLQPFADSITKMGGDKSYFEKALKVVNEAKVGAITGLMQDREFAPNSIDALKRIQKGDYGNLTPIYNSLDQTDKDKVRSSILKGFADEQSLVEINQKQVKAENKVKANALNVELLRPNTPIKRQREIVYTLLGMGEMTVEQADKHLNGEEGKGDIDLYLQLNDRIARGVVSSLGDLAMYKDRLSRAEYKSLGTAMTSTQGTQAVKMINLEAGIQENAFVTEDQKAKKKELLELYQEELNKTTVDSKGVGVFVTPTEAAQAAIDRYNKSKKEDNKAKAIDKVRKQILEVLEKKKLTMPNLPIESIDFSKIKGLSVDEAAALKKARDEAMKVK